MEIGSDSNDQPIFWKCRALQFDRELLGVNKTTTNSQLNVYVKSNDKNEEISSEQLDKLFSEHFGEVKSAKVSMSIKGTKAINEKNELVAPTQNGYGFVCFQNKEDADKAVAAEKLNNLTLIKYQPKDPREIRKTGNNIYVKNFPITWTKEFLTELFGKYGEISSLVTFNKESKKDGEISPFAFVCYQKEGDINYGPECAEKAVTDLHGQTFEGQVIYVQHAIPLTERQAAVNREQQRFKNSKKKCNLFVKNFPSTYNKEKLFELFAECGEIESIKIIEAQNEDGQNGRPQGVRAFICYKQPDSAAQARVRFHNQNLDGKSLYVTNYELPEIRRKQQIENKDKADFFTQKKNNALPLEASLLNRPDTFQLIHQILQFLQKSMQPNNRFPGNGFNNGGQRGGPQGQQRFPRQGGPMGSSGPRQPYNNNSGYFPQRSNLVQMNNAPVPQVAAQSTAVYTKESQHHMAHQDP